MNWNCDPGLVTCDRGAEYLRSLAPTRVGEAGVPLPLPPFAHLQNTRHSHHYHNLNTFRASFKIFMRAKDFQVFARVCALWRCARKCECECVCEREGESVCLVARVPDYYDCVYVCVFGEAIRGRPQSESSMTKSRNTMQIRFGIIPNTSSEILQIQRILIETYLCVLMHELCIINKILRNFWRVLSINGNSY